MKKQLILNEQKLKFYSTNQLRYSDRMRSNFREEISDKDTLVNYIVEQLKCNKVDEVSWSCFLQELMACVEIEQVPETFAELKELCKKLKIGDCEVYITLQLTDKMKLYFYDNGEIIGAYLDFEYEFSLAKGRTPQQMWQIIKSLIGEE